MRPTAVSIFNQARRSRGWRSFCHEAPDPSLAVITTTGKIAADYVVVAFADDPSKWGVGTRFVRTARPDQTGGFVLDGLSPADYLLVALEYVEAGEESDPDLLERLSRDAMRVTIEAGVPKSVTLRPQ